MLLWTDAPSPREMEVAYSQKEEEEPKEKHHRGSGGTISFDRSYRRTEANTIPWFRHGTLRQGFRFRDHLQENRISFLMPVTRGIAILPTL